MVRIIIESNTAGEYTGFVVEGHAGFDQPGQDIVCAAVSVLTQTTALSLKRILKTELETFEISEGKLVCRVDQARNSQKHKEIQLLFRSMVLGLVETSKSYPEYLELEYT